ncbi:MAG: hypothetical protein H6933_12675 [Burkholderiaceae bacterium]|nr:hypothetical protein [Burkholderiaceae bacterium]
MRPPLRHTLTDINETTEVAASNAPPHPGDAPAIRRWPGPMAGLVAAVLAVACGDATPPAAPAQPSASPAPAADRASKPPRTTADARPEDTLPPPRCPPAAAGPARAGAPDIVGLRLGMGFDEALNHARCAVDGGVLAYQPRWFQQLRTGNVKLERQGFSVQRGETSDCVFKNLGDAMKCGVGRRVWHHVDEMITAATPGLDGRQVLAGIWRQQHWRPGQMPSRDAVLQALRDKYGREGELRHDPHGTVAWRYAPDGKPLTPRDPLFGTCAGIRARPGSQGWREGCGLSISADLVPPADNPDLVQSLYVGMAHQDELMRIGDAMQAEIDRLEAERRAGEVQRSEGAKPRL